MKKKAAISIRPVFAVMIFILILIDLIWLNVGKKLGKENVIYQQMIVFDLTD